MPEPISSRVVGDSETGKPGSHLPIDLDFTHCPEQPWFSNPQKGWAIPELPKLRELGLGLFQDGDGGVGVSPKGKKIFVTAARLPRVPSKRIGPCELKASQCTQRGIHSDTGMVEEFLKLR